MSLNFFVIGDPIGKKAPTFVGKGVRMRSGRLIHAVPNTKAKAFQKSIAWQARVAMSEQHVEPLKGDVKLTIYVFLRRAESNKMSRPRIKPDWDNVCKLVGDALNKVAYKDDVQVVEAHVHKTFALPGNEVGLRIVVEAL
jgi:Holliday junction resolvase RusA-like endonuclease